MKKGRRCHQIEQAIAARARRQRGYVTRKQLLQLGLGRDAIKYRVAIGRLIRVHAGVYAVGHVPALAPDRAYGALLACGPQAVLSHGSAAWVWDLEKVLKAPFEITVPGSRSRPGITIHRAPLAREDMATSKGLRVTSPARTLLDLAPRLTVKGRERAVDDLRNSRFLRPQQLVDTLSRYPGHPGAGALRPIAAAPRGATRSDFELRFVDFVTRYALPAPRINAKVGRYEVDALFEDERVVVELDSWRFHSSRSSFGRDRKRDAELLAVGYVTVRITWERLVGEADAVAAELQGILVARRRLLRSAG